MPCLDYKHYFCLKGKEMKSAARHLDILSFWNILVKIQSECNAIAFCVHQWNMPGSFWKSTKTSPPCTSQLCKPSCRRRLSGFFLKCKFCSDILMSCTFLWRIVTWLTSSKTAEWQIEQAQRWYKLAFNLGCRCSLVALQYGNQKTTLASISDRRCLA